jgi:hypothetical protein
MWRSTKFRLVGSILMFVLLTIVAEALNFGRRGDPTDEIAHWIAQKKYL